MHDESGDRIIVVKVRLTEMDVSVVNNWVKVTMFVQLEVSLEVNFEIFENQLDVTVIRQEPEVHILLGINFPVLDSWELDTQECLIK
jgi:hypothetical protein